MNHSVLQGPGGTQQRITLAPGATRQGIAGPDATAAPAADTGAAARSARETEPDLAGGSRKSSA